MTKLQRQTGTVWALIATSFAACAHLPAAFAHSHHSGGFHSGFHGSSFHHSSFHHSSFHHSSFHGSSFHYSGYHSGHHTSIHHYSHNLHHLHTFSHGHVWSHYCSWSRPGHLWWGGGWNGWTGATPLTNWGLPLATYQALNDEYTVDEQGTRYPARVYKYASSLTTESASSSQRGVYRLGPETDLLADGAIAMQLTPSAYLRVGATTTEVIDTADGAQLFSLYSDPSLRWHLDRELERQLNRLKTVEQPMEDRSADQQAFVTKMTAVLTSARQKLGPPEEEPAEAEKAPFPAAFEVFTSVWMTPDGDWLLIKNQDGSFAYLNGKNWYSDEGKTMLDKPYPTKLKNVLVEYLTNLKDQPETLIAGMNQDKQEVQEHLDLLNEVVAKLEKRQKQHQKNRNLALTDATAMATNDPDFGYEELRDPSSLARNKLAVAQDQRRLDYLTNAIETIPLETVAAGKMLLRLNME